MTPEQQRIAIAEACGWGMFDGHWRNPTTGVLYESMPNWLGDLNAMHAAEGTLTEEQQRKWGEIVVKMTNKHPKQFVMLYIKHPMGGENVFCLSSLTAAQRAEAFLRAIGKWEP